MVRVIVDHTDSPGFSSQFETPACPQEMGESGSHLFTADPQLHARGPRRGGVEQIVVADDAQIHADGPRAVVESSRRAQGPQGLARRFVWLGFARLESSLLGFARRRFFLPRFARLSAYGRDPHVRCGPTRPVAAPVGDHPLPAVDCPDGHAQRPRRVRAGD